MRTRAGKDGQADARTNTITPNQKVTAISSSLQVAVTVKSAYK